MTTKAFLEKRGDRVLDGGKILKMRLMEAEKRRGRMRRGKEAVLLADTLHLFFTFLMVMLTFSLSIH